MEETRISYTVNGIRIKYGYIASKNSVKNSIVLRGEVVATIKAANAVEDDDLTTYFQLKNPGYITPASLSIPVNDAATRIPYVTSGAFVSNGIQASRSAIANNIPIRSATGQIKANNAVEADDVITLGQFNNSLKKTVYPSDLGVTFNFGIPFKQSGSDIWGQLVMSQLVGSSTIPQRTGTGQLKCANASADDEAINLSQFKGIINNVLTASETSTTLNATYGSNPIGQVVRSINNNVEYTKISATQWKKETLAIV